MVLDYIVALRLRRNETEPARVALDRLVKEFPTHPRTELAKGRMALADGRVDEAADGLRRYVGMEETADRPATARARRAPAPQLPGGHRGDRSRAPAEGGGGSVETLRLKATIHSAARATTRR